MINTAQHKTGADQRLARILDRCLADLQTGKAVDRDALLAEHADIALDLAGCLDSLELVQGFHAVDGLSGDLAAEGPFSQPLGDYRIIREVGRGGMGVVYEAEQLSLGRRVALKVLPFASMLDPRHLQRFKNEALAAAHLDHPNIVEVYGVGCERGVHFYAMRYVEGQTLAEVIDGLKDEGQRTKDENDTPLPLGEGRGEGILNPDARRLTPLLNPEPRTLNPSAADTSPIAALSTLRTERPKDFYRTVAKLGIQAAEALDHAHQMGIVHRDIKPANLIIESVASGQLSVVGDRQRTTDYGQPTTLKLFITDFGLARLPTDAGMTMTGDLLGTLRYMSPEQAEGKSAILDHRTDICSLGITLYELLTLHPAFPATNRQALLRQIANDEPLAPRRLNKHIPADLETIVLKSIAKDPRDRYTSAGDFAADLSRFAQQKPIAAHPPTRLERTVRWSRGHAGLVLAASVVLLVVATALAVSTILISRAYQDKAAESARADDRSRFAREVVNDMYAQVASKWLANQSKMTPLQVEFLNKALRFYENLVEEEPANNEARADRAMTRWEMSQIHLALGELPQAAALLRQAQTEMQEVVQVDSASPKHQGNLANVEMTLAMILRDMERRDETQTLLERARDRLQRLVSSDPNEPKFKSNLADVEQNLGSGCFDRPRIAEEHLRRAIELYDELAGQGYKPAQKRVDALRATANLANTLNARKRWSESEELLRTSLKDVLSNPDLDQDSPDVAEVVGGAYYVLAQTLSQEGNVQGALAQIPEAVRIFDSLVERFPRDPRFIHFRDISHDAQRKYAASTYLGKSSNATVD